MLLVILTTLNSSHASIEYSRGAKARIAAATTTAKTQASSSITTARISAALKHSFYPDAKFPFLNHFPPHNYFDDSPCFADIKSVLSLRGGSSYSNDNGGGGGYYGNYRDYNNDYETNDSYSRPASGRDYDDSSSYYSRGRNEEDDYYPEDSRRYGRDDYNDDDARYDDPDDYYPTSRSSSVSIVSSKFCALLS